MSSALPTSRFQALSALVSRQRGAGAFTLSRWSNSARARLRLLGHALASLVGAWLCVRFTRQLDWACLVRVARQAGPGAALLVLTPALSNFVHMLGWRGLLPVAMRPRLGRAFAIFLTAQAGNELGSGVLGESFKISLFPAQQRRAALHAVVLDNLTALVALFAVVLTIGSLIAKHSLERFVPLPMAFGALALLLLGAATLGGRAFTAFGASNVWGAFFAHYLGKLWIVADFALWLWLVAQARWHSSALLGLVATVASVLGAPIPGQLGVMEAALTTSAAWVGLGAGTLLSVAVLRRARGLIWIALGGLLLWRLRVQRGEARSGPAVVTAALTRGGR